MCIYITSGAGAVQIWEKAQGSLSNFDMFISFSLYMPPTLPDTNAHARAMLMLTARQTPSVLPP